MLLSLLLLLSLSLLLYKHYNNTDNNKNVLTIAAIMIRIIMTNGNNSNSITNDYSSKYGTIDRNMNGIDNNNHSYKDNDNKNNIFFEEQ